MACWFGSPKPDITYKSYVDSASGAGQDSFCVTMGHKEGDLSTRIALVNYGRRLIRRAQLPMQLS